MNRKKGLISISILIVLLASFILGSLKVYADIYDTTLDVSEFRPLFFGLDPTDDKQWWDIYDITEPCDNSLYVGVDNSKLYRAMSLGIFNNFKLDETKNYHFYLALSPSKTLTDTSIFNTQKTWYETNRDGKDGDFLYVKGSDYPHYTGVSDDSDVPYFHFELKSAFMQSGLATGTYYPFLKIVELNGDSETNKIWYTPVYDYYATANSSDSSGLGIREFTAQPELTVKRSTAAVVTPMPTEESTGTGVLAFKLGVGANSYSEIDKIYYGDVESWQGENYITTTFSPGTITTPNGEEKEITQYSVYLKDSEASEGLSIVTHTSINYDGLTFNDGTKNVVIIADKVSRIPAEAAPGVYNFYVALEDNEENVVAYSKFDKDITLIKNTRPTIDVNYSNGFGTYSITDNSLVHYYGTNIPDKFKTKANFSTSDDGVGTGSTVRIQRTVENSTTDITTSNMLVNQYIDIWNDLTNYYQGTTRTYKISASDGLSMSSTSFSIYRVSDEADVMKLTSSLSTNANVPDNTVYIGDITGNTYNRTLNIAFTSGYEGSVDSDIDSYSIKLVSGSNEVEVHQKTSLASAQIDIKNYANNLTSGEYSIVASLYTGGDLKGTKDIGTLTVKKNTKPNVDVKITNGLEEDSTDMTFYYGNNVPDSFKAIIKASLTDDGLNNDGTKINIYRKVKNGSYGVVATYTTDGTYSILDDLNSERSKLPFTYAYDYSDGLYTSDKIELTPPITSDIVEEYTAPKLTFTNKNSTYYSGDVSDSFYSNETVNKQYFTISYGSGRRSSSYKLKNVKFYTVIDGVTYTLYEKSNINNKQLNVSLKDFTDSGKEALKKIETGNVTISYDFTFSYTVFGLRAYEASSSGSETFNFKKNTAPTISNIDLQHADGHYYTKDIKESLDTILNYTFSDDDVYLNSRSASFYYTEGTDTSHKNLQSLGSTSLGDISKSFSKNSLFENNQQNVTIWYVLSDGISDSVTGKINTTPINFESISKTVVYGNGTTEGTVDISNTFGNDLKIYYGDVKDSAKSVLTFYTSKVLTASQVKVKVGDNNFTALDTEVVGGKTKFTLKLSEQPSFVRQNNNYFEISIDDNLTDVVKYYVTNSKIGTLLKTSTSQSSAYGFQILKNNAASLDVSNSAITIPSINNGVVYTEAEKDSDVRSDRESTLSIKVNKSDSNIETSNLYKVYLNTETTEIYKGNANSLDTYNLSKLKRNGTAYLYIVIDDGIAPAKYVNISGQDVDASSNTNKSTITFVQNKQPVINTSSVSNVSTGNKIYYGDVNKPNKISVLSFTAQFGGVTGSKKDYKIYNGGFTSETNDRYFDSNFGATKAKTYDGVVSYNLTEQNYDKFANKNFYLSVLLDDDIADVYTSNIGNYTFVKNDKPSLSGTILYGTGYNNKEFQSIFTGLDDSAQIDQKIETTLLDSIYESFNYKVYETDSSKTLSTPLEVKNSTSNQSPTFSLTSYSKSQLLDPDGKYVIIVYDDGIWDSSIANENLEISLRFAKAGKPEIISSGTYISGAYKYNDNYYIYDVPMNENYSGANPFKGATIGLSGKSANTEIYLSTVRFEYSTNNGSSWNTVPNSSRSALVSLDNQTSTSFNKTYNDWFNFTTNSNNKVKFRFVVTDELGQTEIYDDFGDSLYLVKEYKPGRISRFSLYNQGTNQAFTGGLKYGATYTFRWGNSIDTNASSGDDISKYVISITFDGNTSKTEIDVLNASDTFKSNPFMDWKCDMEGDVKFQVYAIDKFGYESSVLTMIRSANQNNPPEEIKDVESTVTSMNNKEFIKVYGTTSEQRALTTYTLTFTNAGDKDETAGKNDYIEAWEIQYNTKDTNNESDWNFLKTINNTGNQIKAGETVSTTFYITENSADVKGATAISFRVIARDTVKDETTSTVSKAYQFTDDNRAPVWDDIANNRINFSSPDGRVIKIDSTLVDESEIAYVIVNGENVTKEEENGEISRNWEVTGANKNTCHLIYTIYKDGQYWFRIGDVYGNEYSGRFNAEGIDQVPPTVEVSQEIAEQTNTNRDYNLYIAAVDNLTGLKQIEITRVGITGKTNTFATLLSDTSVYGQMQVNYTYPVTEPGDYTVTVWDRAENKTVRKLTIDNINKEKPTFTYNVPEGLKNKKLTVTFEASVPGTRQTGTLGSFKVLNTSTVSSYGEFKVTSSDGTKASLDISQNGRLDVVFTDIFGNESDVQHVEINNVLVGDIDNNIKYLMLASDYKANYTEAKPTIRVNGEDYVEWNNNQTTDVQLYAYIELSADFNGLQYAWFDTTKNGTTNQTYWNSYPNGEANHPDRLLYRFNTARKAFYIVDIFGNFTQVVVNINGYVAPPDCEINYTILNKDTTSGNVDVYFEITSGKFIDEGFYNETIDGVTKNLYNDFVWGVLKDGVFVEDNSYKEKSFKYTFTENGTLNVWGRSTIDDSRYEQVRVTITNIDKSVPVVDIEDFDTSPQADKLTITAHTNSTFFTLDEFKAQMIELGNSLTDEEINSYTVSADGKTASITFNYNNQGIFFFAKNSIGTVGNSRSITINNIYQSKLSMDLFVILENGDSIPYDEYALNKDKYSGVITVRASASSSAVDTNDNPILVKFDREENAGCEITDTPLSTGGNMVTATYVFTQDGVYTFKLRDAYTGYLEKTVVIGTNAEEPVSKPSVTVKTENVKGDNVPYVTSVIITLTIDGDNDFTFDENKEKTITKEVTENGKYTFVYSNENGDTFSEDVNISSIYISTTPKITVDYNNEFTTGAVIIKAVVSGGVFVDYDSNWLVLTDANGKPTSMQRTVTSNEDIYLYAKDFYEDSTSLVEKKVSIVNIDKDAPLDPDISYNIDSNGLLVIDLLDNGDVGTSGTASYQYKVYSDTYTQEGTIPVNEASIMLNSSDQRFDNGRFSIDVVAIDNAGNKSSGITTNFNSDDRLVKNFNQVYTNILNDINLEDNKAFYEDIVTENRALLSDYSNDIQKDYVSDKLDLLQNILDSDDSAQAILIAKIEDGLKSLSKNPSDSALASSIRGYIAALTDDTLRDSYTAQLDAILNLNSTIENKKKASQEFNYNVSNYTVNPVSGVITKSGVDGYFDENGLFVRGYDTNDYYYLEDGTRYPLDLTFRTFTDPKNNSMEITNGTVNGESYYNEQGLLVDTRPEGGFYDWLNRWHEREGVTTYFTVTFKDYDGTVLKEDTVVSGQGAVPPLNPTRDGYTFNGWDSDFSKVTGNMIVTALYVQNSQGGEIITPTPTGTPTETPTITPTPNPGVDTDVSAVTIKLNKSYATLYVGNSMTLQASVTPANASYTITWTSSDAAVSVSNGIVTAMKVGDATITATTNNGLTATCNITVISNSSSGETVIPGSSDYPTIGDIVTPTPTPSNPVSTAPSFNAGTFGNEGVGYTTTTNFDASNLRGFYNNGYSKLIYTGNGTFDVTNKRGANVSLGFLNNGIAVVMDSRDIDSNLSVSSFGLSGNTVNVNSGRLGNNSYVVLFTDYNQNTTVKKDGSNIASDYDFSLGGYKITNPASGSYTLGSIVPDNVADTDLAARYGFVTDSYSGNITYSEIVKMAYNALNRDFGEELYSSIPTNSPIYRELSILEKYGVIDATLNSYYPNVNSAVTGKDAYDILYMTLSQIAPSRISYDVSSWRYLQGVSLQQINSMVASITQ